MILDENDFERRLEQLPPRPLDAAHRTATLARTDAVRPIDVSRRRVAPETRRLLAAAAVVLLLAVLRGSALTALAETATASAHQYTRAAEEWARYVQRVHALELPPQGEAASEPEAVPVDEDGPQASHLLRINRWA